MKKNLWLLLVLLIGFQFTIHYKQTVFAQSKQRKVKPVHKIVSTTTITPLSAVPAPTAAAKLTTSDIIRGVNYNPIAIGTRVLDSTAPSKDVEKIKQMGANFIGTYNAGLFEWENTSDIDVNAAFYDSLANQADLHGLKVIVGYFSNESIDWLDVRRVAKVTNQYQQLVIKSANRPSTAMMLIGNELFEKLPSDTSRVAYAKWVGHMTKWTHENYPKIPVTYADNHAFTGLYWLKLHAPELDIYSINTYEWTNAQELVAIIDRATLAWNGKPILLHEWGVDSWDNLSGTENTGAQADRIGKLAVEIDKAIALRPQLLGSLYFEYTDQWDKVESHDTQDAGVANWPCLTCFEYAANEDYWGLTKNTLPRLAGFREHKSAYSVLKELWK